MYIQQPLKMVNSKKSIQDFDEENI